eukprot:602469-Hanusia_phi.AAC.1
MIRSLLGRCSNPGPGTVTGAASRVRRRLRRSAAARPASRAGRRSAVPGGTCQDRTVPPRWLPCRPPATAAEHDHSDVPGTHWASGKTRHGPRPGPGYPVP